MEYHKRTIWRHTSDSNAPSGTRMTSATRGSIVHSYTQAEAHMQPIRILIADDHLFYREGVRSLLSQLPDIEVVGEATNGDEVIAKAADLLPDVILMDIKMPKLNGIEATRRILEHSRDVAVLVVTMFDDDDAVF